MDNKENCIELVNNLYSQLLSYESRYELVYEILNNENSVNISKTIWLDVGYGGPSTLAQNFQYIFPRVLKQKNIWYIGVDLYNKPELPEELETYSPHIDFVIADANKMPFRDKFAHITTEYGVSKDEKEGDIIRKEAARVTRKNLFILTEYSSTFPLRKDIELTYENLKGMKDRKICLKKIYEDSTTQRAIYHFILK